MATANDSTETRIIGLKQEVESTCKSITARADTLRRTGKWTKSWDTLFRSITAILAVASPALVTYSQNPGHGSFQLPAIFITGIAGASATLQSIFGFRQGFIRAAKSALNLRSVVEQLRSEAEAEFKNQDRLEIIGKVRGLLDHAKKQASQIEFEIESIKIKEYEEDKESAA